MYKKIMIIDIWHPSVQFVVFGVVLCTNNGIVSDRIWLSIGSGSKSRLCSIVRHLTDRHIAQLVVTSPMVRALETAVGAFGGGVWQGRGRVLMLDQKPEPGVRVSA